MNALFVRYSREFVIIVIIIANFDSTYTLLRIGKLNFYTVKVKYFIFLFFRWKFSRFFPVNFNILLRSQLQHGRLISIGWLIIYKGLNKIFILSTLSVNGINIWRTAFHTIVLALVTHGIFTHNFAIKRYYDILIILSQTFLLTKVSSRKI